jgi:putative membrane protein
MHWDYGWGMGWGTGFGWVFMIFFWVLVVLGIVYFIRIVMTSAKKETSGDTALDILKKRYAKGEITKEEFEKIKNDLKAD